MLGTAQLRARADELQMMKKHHGGGSRSGTTTAPDWTHCWPNSEISPWSFRRARHERGNAKRGWRPLTGVIDSRNACPKDYKVPLVALDRRLVGGYCMKPPPSRAAHRRRRHAWPRKFAPLLLTPVCTRFAHPNAQARRGAKDPRAVVHRRV